LYPQTSEKTTMKIQIVNPIYDGAFKYLMDDNQIAKLILSTILGEEIISLSAKPQEMIGAIERDKEKEDIEL
jgi:hypothetical protein